MAPVGAGCIRAAAQGRSTGARRAPLPPLAGTRGWPGPLLSRRGLGSASPARARHCFPPARPAASQAAPRPRCLRRAWHRRGLGEPSKQRERRPGPRPGKRAAGKWRTAPAQSTGSPCTAPALRARRWGQGGAGPRCAVAPGTLTQRRPRCPAPGAGLFPGTSAVRPGLRRLPGSAGSSLRGWRSGTHRGGGEGGAGSAVAFAGPGPASALAPSLAVPPPPCSWRRRRRFLRLLCPHPSVLGGAHWGDEPAMAAACRRHGYGCGCGARAQPGGGRRAAGIPAPSSARPAAPAARRTPPAPCGASAPQKPGPFPYSGPGTSPRARSRLAAEGNPRGAAGSRAGMEAVRRSGFVSPGPFLSPPRAPVCYRSAGRQELLNQVHRELPPLFLLAGAAPRWQRPASGVPQPPPLPRRPRALLARPACAGEGAGEGGRWFLLRFTFPHTSLGVKATRQNRHCFCVQLCFTDLLEKSDTKLQAYISCAAATSAKQTALIAYSLVSF